MSKESKILRQLRSNPSIAAGMELPNNSGEHMRSIKRTAPVTDSELANKKYVDDKGGVVLGETDSTAYRGDRGKTAYDHSQDNTQAHSDYLLNSAADVGVGLTLTGDNSSADTAYVPMVLYNTDATPPAANTVPIGTLYVQYTA